MWLLAATLLDLLAYGDIGHIVTVPRRSMPREGHPISLTIMK